MRESRRIIPPSRCGTFEYRCTLNPSSRARRVVGGCREEDSEGGTEGVQHHRQRWVVGCEKGRGVHTPVYGSCGGRFSNNYIGLLVLWWVAVRLPWRPRWLSRSLARAASRQLMTPPAGFSVAVSLLRLLYLFLSFCIILFFFFFLDFQAGSSSFLCMNGVN